MSTQITAAAVESRADMEASEQRADGQLVAMLRLLAAVLRAAEARERDAPDPFMSSHAPAEIVRLQAALQSEQTTVQPGTPALLDMLYRILQAQEVQAPAAGQPVACTGYGRDAYPGYDELVVRASVGAFRGFDRGDHLYVVRARRANARADDAIVCFGLGVEHACDNLGAPGDHPSKCREKVRLRAGPGTFTFAQVRPHDEFWVSRFDRSRHWPARKRVRCETLGHEAYVGYDELAVYAPPGVLSGLEHGDAVIIQRAPPVRKTRHNKENHDGKD